MNGGALQIPNSGLALKTLTPYDTLTVSERWQHEKARSVHRRIQGTDCQPNSG